MDGVAIETMSPIITEKMDGQMKEELRSGVKPSLELKNFDAVGADDFSSLSLNDDVETLVLAPAQMISQDNVKETSLGSIIETVDTSLLAYLDPKSLFLLSTVSKQYYEKTVHQYIFATCSKQLNAAVMIGDSKNYEISFYKGRSFYQKIDPWECIFSQVTTSVGLLDIFRRAYGLEKFPICEALYLEKGRLPKKENDERRSETLVTVLCNLYNQHSTVAHGLARYIMNRDVIRDGYGKEYYDYVWDWLDFLIRLKVSHNLCHILFACDY
jgi:hypothetical protein